MLHVRTAFRIAAAVRYDTPIIEPIYTAANAQPAYQPNWGLTLCWRQTPVPDGDWLVKWLQQDQPCHQLLVVQPLGRSANKTDRRDAHVLSELLWINRQRLLRGDRVQGVR